MISCTSSGVLLVIRSTSKPLECVTFKITSSAPIGSFAFSFSSISAFRSITSSVSVMYRTSRWYSPNSFVSSLAISVVHVPLLSRYAATLSLSSSFIAERASTTSAASIPLTFTRLYSDKSLFCISRRLSFSCPFMDISCIISRSRCNSLSCSSMPVISSDAVLRIVSMEDFSSFISFPLLHPAIYPKEYSDVSMPKCWHTV